MQIKRDVFQAIADPNRREIINLVAHQKLTLNGVAEHFKVSRPAISKHIKILTECGLITITQIGRERYCEAKLEKLGEVSDWIEMYREFRTAKLDALDDYLTELKSKKELPTKRKNHGTEKRTLNDLMDRQLVMTRVLNA
jgi:DNA-binding transcriptional ArsR family regulator